MGRFDHLIGTEMSRGTWSWTPERAMLYAVGVGAGQQDATQELQFTTENTAGLPQQVIPSFLSLMTTGKPWMKPLAFETRDWGGGLEWDWPRGMVHGEQGVSLHRPLPASGEVEVSLVLAGVYDKGSGALVIADQNIRLKDSGELLGTARAGFFVRGQGGFGGPRTPPDEPDWSEPGRAPDATVVMATAPNQSLIYRLSGDHNPHCTDPARARADGFERPILQGMGTYGFACRALLQALCGGEVARFGAMHARISQPLYPGEVLETLMWRTPAGAQFRTVTSTGKVVLDRGGFTYAA